MSEGQAAFKGGNVFEQLSQLSAVTRKIGIANPDDILSEEQVWPAGEMSLPPEKRSEPRVRLELKPGAVLTEVEIRGLSGVEQDEAEAIMDRVMPPRIQKIVTTPGQPAREVPDGYDDMAPEYLKERAKLQSLRRAYVVLKGVCGLEAATPGADLEEKLKEVQKQQEKLLRYLASEILNFTYSAGDLADFFCNSGSSNSPR